MCGIVGITRRDEITAARMAATLVHRGPDAGGVYVADDAPLALGHRRLSILDLDRRGDQPLHYEHQGRRFVLVYNGEIYNHAALRDQLEGLGHRFRTTTDSEVILAAYAEWGRAAVARFRGMWALALHDVDRRQLWLSRDCLGKKPLYYTIAGGVLRFASEIKAILVDPGVRRAPNRRVVADYLFRVAAGHTAETFFDGIEALPAGHHGVYDLDAGALTIERHYALPTPRGAVDDDALGERLEVAVRRRLVADVPVSLSLSGGIDSASVAVIAAAATTGTITAFTTTSASGVGDETRLVRRLVDRLPNLRLSTAVLDEARFVADHARILYHMDEPLWYDAAYVRWAIAQAAHEAGFKVLLTGEGADELLGGYFPAFLFVLRDLWRGRSMRPLARAALGAALQPERWMIAMGLYAIAARRELPWLREADARRERYRIRLDFERRGIARSIYEGDTRDYLRWALGTFFLPYLLNANDKMSMAHSVESRAPFLDVDLVELALSIAPERLIDRGLRKAPLRRAMRGRVPDAILQRRPKDAFASPMEGFFRRPAMQRAFRGAFADPRLRALVDVGAVRRGYERCVAGEGEGIEFLSRLYWLERWSQAFDVAWEGDD